MTSSTTSGRCASCMHFRNDPAFLETAFKGLGALSSGYGSTRGDDGICLRHDRYLSARASCPQFTAAGVNHDGGAKPDAVLEATITRAIEAMLLI